MALPAEYLAVLERLALAFKAYKEHSGHPAVLVGGAATAIYTVGSFLSFDFDVVAGADAAFEAALREHGFVREHRPGFLQVGFYHPEHPEFGVQQVTPPLFDGKADWTRNKRLLLAAGGEVTLPSIEDMIADRLAQHAIASPTDTSRLAQARRLFGMAEQLDHAYLWQRITDEGGDPALIELVQGTQEGK